MRVGHISVPPDGKYRVPGGPDPTKSRAERNAELRGVAGTDAGTEIIAVLAHEAMGLRLGTGLPAGMSANQLIERVLDHEYPKG
jgi:hypothetical protein